MKNILIVASGDSAKVFLSRISDLVSKNRRFHVVYYQKKSLPGDLSEHILTYKFDPTSYVKMESLLKSHEFTQAIIIMSNITDTKATYENIRKVDEQIHIVLHDKWSIDINDSKTTIVNVHDIVSNFLMNYIPDIPIYAANIGLGQGEIAEFMIPSGSPFSYRYMYSIEQKRWKVVAIYRDNRLIIPERNDMILPNDSILAVGNPNVLKSVYKSINREFGQFPIPFGENIYCFIDMSLMRDEEIEKLTNDSMLLHSNLNSNKLIFRVYNPRYSKSLDKIKSYDSHNMCVEIDFQNIDKDDLIKQDVDRYRIGLFITNNNFFHRYIELLYNLKIPILKLGTRGFYHIKELLVMGDEAINLEKISSIIFDISAQLKLNITLYNFEESDESEREQIVEHFQNLSRLFEQNIKIVNTKSNPIRVLKDRDDFLQFIPFDHKIIQKKIFAIFSNKLNSLYFELEKNYQIFIPSEE